MADSIGTFSAKHTGNTYSTSADGELVINAHFEGGSDAYGDGFATLTVTQKLSEAGATGGTCTYAGQAFKDGNTLGALGEGTWEQTPGESKWKLTLDINGSNGDRVRAVGVIDLANRSWDGEMFPG